MKTLDSVLAELEEERERSAALAQEVGRLRALLLDQGRANARLTVANAQLARRLSSALGEEVARD